MNQDDSSITSRRSFIRLAAASAGVLTGLPALAAEDESTGAKRAATSPSAPRNHPSVGRLQPKATAYQTVDLSGEWSVTALPIAAEGEAGYAMCLQGLGEHYPAQVPGEIHLDLMRLGRMEDPSLADNARARCRWPEEHSWWYRKEFIVPDEFRANYRQQLILQGVDLYGQVFVNGTRAGMIKSAFVTTRLDVGRLLRDGLNVLVVRVTSGMELIPPSPPPSPEGAAWVASFEPIYSLRTGDTHEWAYLRKPDYNAYGTDMSDPLPNIGITGRVYLEGRRLVVIDSVRLDTIIRGEAVSLEGEVILDNLHPYSELHAVLELQLEPPNGPAILERRELGVQVGRIAVPCLITVPNPELWWPNGMGEQPLYQLTARVLCGDAETDVHRQTIGLRTIELDRSPIADGSRFCFKVNGKDVFCKGGNWVPDDLIPARSYAKRCKKLIAEAKNAHLNMLRVNGFGYYESDAFYAACDEAGILVWQDFSFSDAKYPDQDAEFLGLIHQEVVDAIRRLRHHPSLVLWCGSSECTWGMIKCDPRTTEVCGGVRIYNELLPDVCHELDPLRPYWPSSPFGGPEPNSSVSGDTHMILPDKNVTEEYWQSFGDSCKSRFISEFGVLGPPNMASVRQYFGPGELTRESPIWAIHTNGFDKLRGKASMIAEGIRYHYGDPENFSLAQFVLYGQMFQALLHGSFVEASRFRKNDSAADCQGVLVWSYNDIWGEIGWSLIDYYLRRKASYYWFRRASAPVKVLVRSRDGHLVTRVVNDMLKGYKATVRCGWVRLDGSAQEWQEHSVTLPVNGMIEVARVPLASPAERDPREWIYAATISGSGFPQDQALWLLVPHRDLVLSKPVISTEIRKGILEISSPVYCHGVHLEDEGHEVLVDNYFDLLPGIPYRVPITAPTAGDIYPLTAAIPIIS
jgi:beta-mannosidase